jgi:predicted nucleic acid-binding protein
VIFVDTSAFLAVLAADDQHHPRAAAALRELRDAGEELVTHDYVLVETLSLVQRRLGMDVLRRFVDGFLPLVEVIWVDQALHTSAREMLITTGRRTVSFVDWTSFLVMRRHGIRRTFTFDADFAAEGFEVLPSRELFGSLADEATRTPADESWPALREAAWETPDPDRAPE